MQLLLAAAMITIRIYNYSAVPQPELAAARAGADRIFDNAGISIAWIDCRVPGSASGAACTEPLGDTGEFVLRLQKSSPAGIPRYVALGSSLIDRDAASGVLITLHPQLVAAVASQAGVDSSTVLGRAIAHEVGHLLLGNAGHSSHGLMRAVWSQNELRGDRSPDWHFSADEAALMHRTLARALRAQNAGKREKG